MKPAASLAVAAAVVIAGLAVIWRYGPGAAMLEPETLAVWARRLGDEPWFPVALPLAYAASAPVFAPATPINVAVILVFGFPEGVLWALLGSLAAALIGWGVGRALGTAEVFRMSGPKTSRLLRRLRTDGLIPVAATRLAPVAPFTALNLAAGALRVPFRTFVGGTILGMAPGLIAIGVFRREVVQAIENPGLPAYATLGMAVAGAGLLFWWLRRKLPVEQDDPGAVPFTRS